VDVKHHTLEAHRHYSEANPPKRDTRAS